MTHKVRMRRYIKMNEDNQEKTEYTQQDAIDAIESIAKEGLEQTELLNDIESDLTDINQHITNLDEYIVINNKEDEQINKKENEEKSEEVSEEKSEKSENELRTESTITIDDVHAEIETVNENLAIQNNLLTVGIFSQGILIGVLVLTLFWNRFIK